jgi:uncharacterized protein HemX
MFGISRAAGTAIGILVLVLLVIGSGWLMVREIRSMVSEAAESATAAADAKWTAKIEEANAAANQKVADQAKAALQIEADANSRINAASRELEELRKRNAALPNAGAVGLSADRGRLLPN